MSNIKRDTAVAGIDVGGIKKGFHAVVIHSSEFAVQKHSDPAVIVNWIDRSGAQVVAVDAPCKWSINGTSRLVEKEMNKSGIKCFYSPSREKALNHSFYGWMLNGELLYQCLEKSSYKCYYGQNPFGKVCVETFPHAIVMSLCGRNIPDGPKNAVRRQLLRSLGYDTHILTNVDYLDAALCAYTALQYTRNNTMQFGDTEEGFIVVPRE